MTNRNHPNSKIFHQYRWHLLGILLVFAFSTFLLYWFMANRLTSTTNLSSRDSAIKQTRELLTAVKDHPTGSMPDTLPGYLRGGIGCWAFFQYQMAQDSNQYKIGVSSEYDSRNSSEVSRDMTEIWLNVDFSNGRSAEIYYYQGGLAGCREK
jgi:hypothetical protein